MEFLKALAVFTGTIIGVGIFGLPYVASKAGFLPVVFYFFFLSGLAIIIHLLLARVALGTERIHRQPGYAGEYLGENWKKISFVIFSFGLTGALLAYLIVGGEFLTFLLAPLFGGDVVLYTLLFFCAGTYLILRGIKSISQIELSLLLVFFVILVVFFMKAIHLINIEYFKTIDWKFLTFPYGVILFSLWGTAMVPEIKEMLNGREKALQKVIIGGILIAAIVYLFFTFTILGVSGSQTTKEAMSGFVKVLGDNVVGLGFIFGIITCFTSFITLGLTLKKVFWYDFNMPKHLSWFIACFLPLFLFLAGLREFIDVIGLTGAFALGGDAILTVFIYREFLKKKGFGRMNPLIYSLPVFFILGIIFEVFYFVVR